MSYISMVPPKNDDKKHTVKTQLPSTCRMLQVKMRSCALSRSLSLDTYKNIYICIYIYIYTSDACFRNLLYFTHGWIFFWLPGISISLQLQDTNSGNPAWSKARCHAICQSDKQADAITERPSDLASSEVGMQTFAWWCNWSVNRLGGMIRLFNASEPPGGSTNNTGGMVGKIWILLSRAPNFRDVPTKPLRTTVTSCMEEGIASSKSCCWGGGLC